MNSKIVFGQYYHAQSWIHKLDPRTKLICLFSLMISIFLITNLYILLGMLGLIIVLVLFSKIPVVKFLQGLKMMAFLMMFTVIFQILFNRSGNLTASYNFNLDIFNLALAITLLLIYFILGKFVKKFRLLTFLLILAISLLSQYHFTFSKILVSYKVNIYDEGIISSLKVVTRIIILISLSSLLTLTTKPTDLNNGLESVVKPLKIFKVNVSIFSMMISLALRFIPTLINEANRILKAQASRGVDFKEGKLREKITQIISLLIPMFVIAYKRAEDLANAMEARGYIPGAERSKLNELKFCYSDYLTFIFSVIILGVIISLRIVL
ncbi:MAG TPA: energy-coupling factor transporter transmembrane protein EcfT [Acholeplasmataceae bacterium]|nr:energy-coupling factor transporter transmembrane protein EcfT [Acholeplasmataceae bacterium]